MQSGAAKARGDLLLFLDADLRLLPAGSARPYRASAAARSGHGDREAAAARRQSRLRLGEGLSPPRHPPAQRL